jgi:hypothetical protein
VLHVLWASLALFSWSCKCRHAFKPLNCTVEIVKAFTLLLMLPSQCA